MIVISIVFIGNFIIFIVICSIRCFCIIDNVFIVNLVVSDFFFMFIEICFNIIWRYNEVWKLFYDFVCYVIMVLSVFCVFVLVFI